MPPKRAAKQADSLMQDKENIDPATLSKQMRQSRDKRKAEKRNQLQAKFDSEMARAEGEIEELLGAAVDESIAGRVDFTTRLMELFKKRGDIEAQIIAHSQVLEEAYAAANTELKEILKGKLEDIDEGPKALQPEDG